MPTDQRDRKTYVGSHDCAAIMGLSDRDDALSVWRRKTGRLPETPDTPALIRGRRLEDIVLDWYASTYGAEIHRCGTIEHPTLPFMATTPDAALYVAGRCAYVVEAKTVGSAVASEFGAEGSDVVPAWYWAQAQAHMAVTGAPVCDMPVLFGGYRFEFRCFRIIRNDEFILRWFAVAESFWRDHVLADVAPRGWLPDSRDEWAKERWPRNTGPMLETDDPSVLAVVERFREADLAYDRASAEYDDAEADLIELIGSAEGIRTPDFTVTYRASKKGVRSLKPSWRAEK